MVATLRTAAGTSVIDAVMEHNVNEQTICAWRKHFDVLAPSEVKCLRMLEAENARLIRLLADRDLDISMLKEIKASE